MATKLSRMENYTVRLPEETLQLLFERAEREGVKPAELARVMMAEALGASVRTESSIRLAVETLQHSFKDLNELVLVNERQVLSVLGILLLMRTKIEKIPDAQVEGFLKQIFYEGQDMGEALRPAFKVKEG